MGVVKRQSIKQSIVTYVGVALGMVNVLFIYPLCFQESELGIMTYVRETAMMLALFSLLGSAGVTVRYFPIFKNQDNGHNGFLFLMCAIATFGIGLISALYFTFEKNILTYFSKKEEDPELYLTYIEYLLPFTFFMVFAHTFTYYISNFQRIVVPTIFNELFIKIGLPILALSYLYGLVSLDGIFQSLVFIYFIIVIALIGYTMRLGQLFVRPNFSFLKKELVGKIVNYSFYGFLGGLGSRLSGGFISIFMVGTLDTPSNTGIYTIAYFISNVIEVPRKAISKITAPLLADKWERGLIHEIADLYQRSSLNQFIIGMWMILAIWVSIDELFQIMPNGDIYAAGKYVVLLLGMSKVVDMVTGVNSEIISNSKYYRFNFYLVLILAVLNIGANIVLIPKYKLIGAAMATLLSLAVYNFIKFLVLKWKMDIQPFSWQTIYVLLISGFAYLATIYVPATDWAILNIALKSSLLTLVFGALILYFKVSPDLDDMFKHSLKMVKDFLNREKT